MTKNRKQYPMLQSKISDRSISLDLKSTDQAVFKYLAEQTQRSGETCIASIPSIASACDISERQVQISTRRLIEAGLIARIGYDFSNPDRLKRGTIYKVLAYKLKSQEQTKRVKKKRSIKFILFWSEE